MSKITTRAGQTLFDIAVETTGNADNAVAIAVANDLPVSAQTLPDTLVIPDDLDMNTQEKAVFTQRKIHPATSASNESEDIRQGGIEYMGIEIDFIVS